MVCLISSWIGNGHRHQQLTSEQKLVNSVERHILMGWFNLFAKSYHGATYIRGTTPHLIEGELLEVDTLGLLPGNLVEEGQHRRLACLKLDLRKRHIKAAGIRITRGTNIPGVGNINTCRGASKVPTMMHSPCRASRSNRMIAERKLHSIEVYTKCLI